jgi:hypothetical protein
MTKSQQVAQLLLRPEGCTYADAVAVTGWPSISIPWHAKNNGLRLRIEKAKGQPHRYFGERRKIEVRKVVKPWQPPVPAAAPEQKSELAIFCAAHDFAIHYNEGKNRVLRCIHCHLGFRIFQKDDFANPYLKKHLKQHARIHHPSYLAQSLQGLVNEAKKERFHEQCGQFAQQA